MKQSYNAVAYMGGKPEVRSNEKGNMTTWSMAIKSGWGEGEKTNWVRCSAIGKTGEAMARYGDKGRLVAIEGQWVSYDAKKDGFNYTGWSVRVNSFTLLDKKPQDENKE